MKDMIFEHALSLSLPSKNNQSFLRLHLIILFSTFILHCSLLQYVLAYSLTPVHILCKNMIILCFFNTVVYDKKGFFFIFIF